MKKKKEEEEALTKVIRPSSDYRLSSKRKVGPVYVGASITNA